MSQISGKGKLKHLIFQRIYLDFAGKYGNQLAKREVMYMSGKLPVLKPKNVIKALERNGYYIHRVTGSHYILKKGKLRATVPYHNKDLKPGTIASIIKQVGLTVEEFLDLL
jgi:predicted RNA binding protein YcfA (HicA-like mRNA interferase family)